MRKTKVIYVNVLLDVAWQKLLKSANVLRNYSKNNTGTAFFLRHGVVCPLPCRSFIVQYIYFHTYGLRPRLNSSACAGIHIEKDGFDQWGLQFVYLAATRSRPLTFDPRDRPDHVVISHSPLSHEANLRLTWPAAILISRDCSRQHSVYGWLRGSCVYTLVTGWIFSSWTDQCCYRRRRFSHHCHCHRHHRSVVPYFWIL